MVKGLKGLKGAEGMSVKEMRYLEARKFYHICQSLFLKKPVNFAN
jgi:hypothetical protein